MGLFKSLCSIGFTINAILYVAVPSHAATLRKRSTDCDVGPGWAPVLTIGSTGYGNDPAYVYACETQYGQDHTPVSGIEVWRKGDDTGGRIAGLQFTYASGYTSPVYGQEDTSKYPSASLTLAPGEVIKNAILYGDGGGAWLGHIHIETPHQTFDAGRDTVGINPYGINVGSGLLYGANIVTHASNEGKGSDIADLSFLFLGQPIDHIGISDVVFNNDPAGTNSGISPQNIVVGTWYNGFEGTVGFSQTPTYAVTQSYSYSQATTFSFGGSIQIELSAELFGVGAKSDTTYTWGVSHDSATTTGTTSATSVACQATGTLLPGQGVRVHGSYQTGVGRFDYVSTVTVYLKDGTNFSYKEQGKLTNVAYNECNTSYETVNDPSIVNSPGMSSITGAPSVTPTSTVPPSSATSTSKR